VGETGSAIISCRSGRRSRAVRSARRHHNLFYAPLYNESVKPSAEFPDKSVAGITVPGEFEIYRRRKNDRIAKNIELIAAQVAKILAQDIESNAENTNKLLGNKLRLKARR
jgi:hypothetical protein